MPKFIYPFIFSFLFVFTAFAGNKYEYTIEFKGATIETTENLHEFVTDPGIQPEEMVGERYYRLIQFANLPTEHEKKVLAAGGIDLLSYVPNYTYIASFHRLAALDLLLQTDVRGVYRYQPSFKLHPALIGKDYPDWIILGGNELLISLNYHPNIVPEEVIEAIEPYVLSIEHVSEFGEYMVVTTDVNNLEALASLPHMVFVEPGPEEGEKEDFNGRSMHRSNVLDADYGAGRQYDGTGVGVAVNDDGWVGPHVDFKGRITYDNDVSFNNSGFNTHGDGVAGIIGGAGNIDPYYAGMAMGSDLRIRNYVNTLPGTVTLHINNGIMMFNSSYSNGCNAGYTSTTRQVDQEIRQNPALLQVFSAGNSGNSDCGYVTSGATWGNITGGHKVGKNVIATANLFYDEVIVSSSSRGPAEDGRIKPDIAAHGQGQGSTDENDSYMSFGGTSAASPGIAGICAQMYDAYRSLNSNNDPESALIKAALLNTADDMGNPGPDFEYGWGRVNARRAVELIENNNYLSSTITNSTTNTHNLTIPSNVKEVRVMLYWSDYEATTSAAKDLVNDLDFEVVRPNNQTVLPWVLDPSPNVSALNSPAVRGVDDLNNMEQVTIENPPAGTYTLRVIGSAVPQGPQKYYIVHEFVYDEIIVTYPQGGEGFAPGETVTVRWDAYGRSNGQFSLQYSSNNGGSWSTFASSVHDTLRTYDWSIPNGAPVSGEYLLRVSRGGAVSGQSIENFSVIDIPNNIQITKVCPASTEISWNAVNSATSYDVYLLGQKYMDSVGTTTGTTFTIQGTNHTIDDWISVSANGPNGANGRRAVAVKKSPGVVNCVINTDAEISAISSPAGSYSDCFNTNNIDVSILITNNGSSAISNFDVVYQLDNNPVVRETVSSNIAVNGNAGYTFTADVSFPSVGTYDLKVWPELAGDQNPSNDTIHLTVTVLNSTLVTLPYSEDFESFSSCGTNSDCEAGVCNLSGGWTNLTNGQDDDIDWRTDNGGTPSNNTGPSVDHAPGTVQGNYLYTEASFGQTGCINKTAEMLSPCIDLTSTVNPVMVFYYHMDGQFMGELHVDAFDGTNWFNDIMLPITGDQGDQWFSATANLSQFNGKKIVLRFRGITGSSFTSDLAIDDVNIVDNAPPTAAFSVDKTSVCTNELITVTDASTGSSLNYTWNFGSGSNPSSSTSPGPHTFFYTFPGNKSITLQVTNVAGTDFATESISVTDIPASFFNFNQNNNVISFTNSSSGANSYFWDFGDGNTSTQNAPTHTYSALGTYTVRLISTNGCGSDTSTRSVTIDKLTSLEDITGVEVKLYPNPTSDNAYVDFGRTLNGEAVIRVTDASGKLVLEQIVNDVAGSDLNVSDFAAGIYQVEIRYEEESSVIPLRKQ